MSSTLEYDPDTLTAVLTFTNGRTLKLSNVTRDKAETFHARHADEFERRDCCLNTPAAADYMTRDGASQSGD